MSKQKHDSQPPPIIPEPTSNGNGRHAPPPRDDHREATLNAQADAIVNNIVSGRQFWIDRMTRGLDPRRNIYKECGYPDSGAVDAYKYQELYDREPIAGRVVEIMPKQSWQVQPQVYEVEDGDEPTAFEKAWDGLAKQLRGRSWFKDEEGSPIWDYLLRVDILSGIGHYGALFIGLNDGVRDLSLPAKGVEEENTEPTKLDPKITEDDAKKTMNLPTMRAVTGNGRYKLVINAEETKGRKITMLRALPENQCQVVQWEQNATSPRYGQPVMYLMYFADPQSDSTASLGQPMGGQMVHWTRVLHVADTYHHASASEIIAVPRIKPVLNPVLDIIKVRGAGCEGYWLMAFNLLSFQTHPTLGPEAAPDPTIMKDLHERIANGLQRNFWTSGMDVKSIAPTVSDPTPHITVAIEAICIKLETPVRVFKGSERGELASSQDDEAWNDRVQGRQLYYNTPRIVIPFVDRLIMLGVLPEPTEIEEKEVVDEEAQKKLEEGAGQDEEGTDDFSQDGTADDVVAGSPVRSSRPPQRKPGVFNSRRTFKRRRMVTRAVYNKMVANDFPPAYSKVAGATPNDVDPALQDNPDDMVEVEENVEVPTKVIKTEAGYCIEWPDITSMGAMDKATVFSTKMTGLAAAASGGVEQMIGMHKILTEYGMDDEEATAAIEEGAAAAEDQMQVDQGMMDEHGFKPDAAAAGMVDPEQEKMQHKVDLAKAKNPGFGPGGGAKPPFGKGPPKPFGGKPSFNSLQEDEEVINAFCATGEGGGVDPSCGGEGSTSIQPAPVPRLSDTVRKRAEGANSSQAVKMSDKAKASGKLLDHIAASIANRHNENIYGGQIGYVELGDKHKTLADYHEEQIKKLRPTANELLTAFDDLANNAFCATGENGGIDPSCGTEGESTTHTSLPDDVLSSPEKHLAHVQENLRSLTFPDIDRMIASLGTLKYPELQAVVEKQFGYSMGKTKGKTLGLVRDNLKELKVVMQRTDKMEKDRLGMSGT